VAALLEVKDLRTHFNTRDGVVKAVDGVSYDIQEGETLGLVGESGCGKSVSALSILRLITSPPGRIVGGSVEFDGRDLIKLSDAEMREVRGNDIGMVFQEPMTSLNPVLTIGRQLTEGLELHLKMTKSDARSRAAELLVMVGIPDATQQLKSYPHQFSGGMRQRVMIAMALSCNPKLLIADEPTTALDVTIQAQILELLQKLSADMGTAILIITHNLGVIARYASRVNVMYAGKIVEGGATRELFTNPQHPYTKGLLQSVPRLSQDRTEKLFTIEGSPPDLINLPKGCAFQPRCAYAVSECTVTAPPLTDRGDSHLAACFVKV
jgi:oligopeptide transport system ATP-binding protein